MKDDDGNIDAGCDGNGDGDCDIYGDHGYAKCSDGDDLLLKF